MSIDDCYTLELSTIFDPRGNLTFIENNRHIPFAVKRVYYTYNVPANIHRGAHAHKDLKQLIIALGGRFDVYLHDGSHSKTIRLDNPNTGLVVNPMIWRNITHFSPGTVCLVLASEYYTEDDYMRDFDEFCFAARKENTFL